MRKIKLAPNKARWVEQFKPSAIKGVTLRPAASIGTNYADKLEKLVRKMCRIAEREITALFTHPDYAMDSFGMDASIASRARILTNALGRQFDKLFGDASTPLAEAMVTRADANGATTLKASLKDLSGGLTLKTDFVSEGLQDALTASVAANVDLIKLIPQKYMGDITGAVMRSITTGNGLQDLQPYMEKKYGENVRHARNVAMDQTRKAYVSVTSERMKSADMSKFEWVHSGGSQKPRPYHMHTLNGNIYDMDNPPVIDPKTGERGLPGQLPFCHCTMRPVLDFSGDD